MSWLNPTFVAEDENGSTVSYRDGKRLAWAWSVINPFFAWIGIGLYVLTDQLWWLWYPVFQGYVIFPLLDAWIGEDTNNPPEAVVPQLEQDPYYRWLTYLVVPMHYIVFVGAAWWVMQASLPWHGYLAVAISAGLAAGLGINTGHELGHKNRVQIVGWPNWYWLCRFTGTSGSNTTAGTIGMCPRRKMSPVRAWAKPFTSLR